MLRPIRNQWFRFLFAACFLFIVYQCYANGRPAITAGFGPWNRPHIPDTVALSSPSTFPKHIWYKLGPRGLSPDNKKYTESCTSRNPSWTAHFLNDTEADAYVTNTFNTTHPALVETYLALSVPILKADLLRYLLLYNEGGLWSDLDVECLSNLPIEEWTPTQFRDLGKGTGPALLVGWEFDVGWGHNFVRQFTSWTILSQPRTPHMWAVVEDILASINATTKKHNITVAQLTTDKELIGDVVDFTGPRRLTNSVFRSLEKQAGKKIKQDPLYKISEPKLIGDVVIMPGFSFAHSANKYEEGEVPGEQLVKHHYAGSWKNEAGGEDVDKPEEIAKIFVGGHF